MAKRIHRLISENPYEKMWDTYVYFESEPTTKSYLEKLYNKRNVAESQRLAFQNTPKFIYFIKQAREYFHAAKQSHILVKPLLVYYGMMSLIKSVVLTMDPTYPSNTSVLRHGITTRKIKKLDYVFHEDEIKIQKEGLVPLVYQLMTKKDSWSQSKYRVKDLLSLIPELHESFYRLYEQTPIEPLFIAGQRDMSTGNTIIYVSEKVLEIKNGDIEEFILWLNKYNQGDGFFEWGTNRTSGLVQFQWKHPEKVHVFDFPDGFANPLFRQDYKGSYYLYKSQDQNVLLPEVLVQYLLMYNLGMLCRYETELWGEIIFSFSSGDMFMINELLNVTMRKFPNLILNILLDEVLIFNHI
jgi:hypothetical protein